MDHFIKNYRCETKWVAFIDLDEFIFNKNGIMLQDYLNNQPENVSCIRINQKKFLDIFLSEKKLITQEYNCISEKQLNAHWNWKNIIKVEKLHYCTNIRIGMRIDGISIIPSMDEMRFNHYNVNEKQLSLMKGYFGKEIIIDEIDQGMRYIEHHLENNINMLCATNP